MTKQEYESAISEIANQISDLGSLVNDMQDEMRKILNLVENLPELSELEGEEE